MDPEFEPRMMDTEAFHPKWENTTSWLQNCGQDLTQQKWSKPEAVFTKTPINYSFRRPFNVPQFCSVSSAPLPAERGRGHIGVLGPRLENSLSHAGHWLGCGVHFHGVAGSHALVVRRDAFLLIRLVDQTWQRAAQGRLGRLPQLGHRQACRLAADVGIYAAGARPVPSPVPAGGLTGPGQTPVLQVRPRAESQVPVVLILSPIHARLPAGRPADERRRLRDLAQRGRPAGDSSPTGCDHGQASG